MTEAATNDGLTDEERAALQEDDGAGDVTNTDAADGAGGNDGQEGKGGEDKGEAGADKPADDKPADKPDAEVPDAGATAAVTEAQPQSQPILVAQIPEDADAKIADIQSKKDAVLARFDEGDITAREMQKELDTLNKQERDIEFDVREAKLAGKLEQQRLQNDWKMTCDTFIESKGVYKDNPRLYRALDAEVRDLATKPETRDWSGQQFLSEAHANIIKAFGLEDKIPAKSKTLTLPPNRNLPPNLAKVPSAEIEETSGGKFAVLDRLADSDPAKFEKEMSKLSEDQRKEYLASA